MHTPTHTHLNNKTKKTGYGSIGEIFQIRGTVAGIRGIANRAIRAVEGIIGQTRRITAHDIVRDHPARRHIHGLRWVGRIGIRVRLSTFGIPECIVVGASHASPLGQGHASRIGDMFSIGIVVRDIRIFGIFGRDAGQRAQ